MKGHSMDLNSDKSSDPEVKGVISGGRLIDKLLRFLGRW